MKSMVASAFCLSLNKVRVSLLIAIALGSFRLSAAVLTGPVVNPANGHFYYLLSSNTWTASQVEAVSLGGNLVTINDAAENDWVFNTFSAGNRNLWIGLNDSDFNSTYTWADGSAFSYSNWDIALGQPNFGAEHWVFMAQGDLGHGLTARKWHDVVDNPSSQFPWIGSVFGVVELLSPPQAPTSITGRTILLNITSGSSPFASNGAAGFIPSATDSSYSIVPISGPVIASTGTHTYTKTSANTAQLLLTDTVIGVLVADCTFTTPNSGTYIVTGISFLGSGQTGTFVLYSGALPIITSSTTSSSLTLAWPAAATGYRVESAFSLSPPTTWSNVTGSFQTNGGSVSITRPTTGSREFYRLVKP